MKKLLTAEERRVRDWITRNRGVLTRAAVQCQVSPQFVQAIAYGKSTALPGNPVEKLIKSKGWPGIKRKEREYADAGTEVEG